MADLPHSRVGPWPLMYPLHPTPKATTRQGLRLGMASHRIRPQPQRRPSLVVPTKAHSTVPLPRPLHLGSLADPVQRPAVTLPHTILHLPPLAMGALVTSLSVTTLVTLDHLEISPLRPDRLQLETTMLQVDMVDLTLDSRHRRQRMAALLLLGTMRRRLPSLERINMGRRRPLRRLPRETTPATIPLVNINMGKEATSLAGGK